jgi:hypothetical protein
MSLNVLVMEPTVTFFAINILGFHCDSERILEHPLRQSKSNAVLVLILAVLRLVPFEVHLTLPVITL